MAVATYRIFVLGDSGQVTASLTWSGDEALDDEGLKQIEPTRTKEVWEDTQLVGRIAPRLGPGGRPLH